MDTRRKSDLLVAAFVAGVVSFLLAVIFGGWTDNLESIGIGLCAAAVSMLATALGAFWLSRGHRAD